MRDTRRDGAPVIVVCGLAAEAAILRGSGVVTVCGPGPGRVAAGIEALVGDGPDAAQRWAGILSFGCAGGTDPSLRPGDLLVASGIWTVDGPLAADAAWSRALRARLPQARDGLLAGLDAPLAARAAKARLWREQHVCAVDMESHAAARAARRHGLPFAACRAVVDPAWRSLPGCALAAMRPDGGFDLPALLRALAAAPRETAPLAALALDAWQARRTLRRVRARLGAAFGPPR